MGLPQLNHQILYKRAPDYTGIIAELFTQIYAHQTFSGIIAPQKCAPKLCFRDADCGQKCTKKRKLGVPRVTLPGNLWREKSQGRQQDTSANGNGIGWTRVITSADVGFSGPKTHNFPQLQRLFRLQGSNSAINFLIKREHWSGHASVSFWPNWVRRLFLGLQSSLGWGIWTQTLRITRTLLRCFSQQSDPDWGKAINLNMDIKCLSSVAHPHLHHLRPPLFFRDGRAGTPLAATATAASPGPSWSRESSAASLVPGCPAFCSGPISATGTSWWLSGIYEIRTANGF